MVHDVARSVRPVGEYLARRGRRYGGGYVDGIAGAQSLRLRRVRAVRPAQAAVVWVVFQIRVAVLPARLERDGIIGVRARADGRLAVVVFLDRGRVVHPLRAAGRVPAHQLIPVAVGGDHPAHHNGVALVLDEGAMLALVHVGRGGRVHGIARPVGVVLAPVIALLGLCVAGRVRLVVIRAQVQAHGHRLRQRHARRVGRIGLDGHIFDRDHAGDHIAGHARDQALEGMAFLRRGRPGRTAVDAVRLAPHRLYGQRVPGRCRHLGRGGLRRFPEPRRLIGRVRVRHGGGQLLKRAVQLPAVEHIALAGRVGGPVDPRAIYAADRGVRGDLVVVFQRDGIHGLVPCRGHFHVRVGHGGGQILELALEAPVQPGLLGVGQPARDECVGQGRAVGDGRDLRVLGIRFAHVLYDDLVRIHRPHGIQRLIGRFPREGQRLLDRVATRRAGPALEGIALAGGIGEGIGRAAADDGLAAGYAHRRLRGALALGDDHVHRLHLAAAPAVKAQLACDRVLVDVHRRQCDRVVPAARSPRGDGLGIVVRQAVARGVHLAVLLVPPVSEYLAGLLGHIVGHHDGFAGRHTVRHVIVRAAALPFAAIGREHHVRQAQLPIRLEREDVAGIGRAVDGHLFAGLTVSQVDGLVRAPRAALRGPIFQQVAVPRGGADEIHIDLIAHVRQRAAPLGRVQVCPGGRVGIALPGGIRVGRILIPAGVVRAQIQPHHHSLRQGRDRRPGSVRIHVAIARRGDVGDHVVARAGREAIEGQAAPGRGRGRPAGAVVNAVSLARQRRYGQRFTGHRRHLGRGGPIRLDQPCRHIGRVRVRHGGGRRVEHAVQLPALEHAALLRRIDGRGDALAIDVLGHMVRRVLLVVYALRVVGLIDDPVLDGLPYRRHRQVFGGHCLGQGRVPACEFKVFLLRVGRPARYARGQRHSVLHI